MQVIELLLLLVACNGAPVVATRMCGARGEWPVDGGRMAKDGRRWLGASKTWRGLLASVSTGALLAWVMGWSPWFGAGFAALCMVGDLLTSFVKRRIGMESGGRFMLMDQIPESLLPLWFAWFVGEFPAVLILQVVALFVLVCLVSSPILFRLGIRRRPH